MGVFSNVLTPNHYIRSSKLATLYPYKVENLLMNVMQPLH